MLELGDRPDDLKEQPADRGRGVDSLIEGNEVDAALPQLAGELDQMLQRATEPIELRHHELIAGAVQQTAKL